MGFVENMQLVAQAEALKQAKKNAKAAQKSLEHHGQQTDMMRAQHAFSGLEGTVHTISWNGSWLVARVPANASKLMGLAARRGECSVHASDITWVENKPPKLLGDGEIIVHTRDGQIHRLSYPAKNKADFTALSQQLGHDLQSGPSATAISPPPPLAPAGWFAAPDRPGCMRYWNGSIWTEHYHDPSQPTT